MRDFVSPYYEGPHCSCCHEARLEVVTNIIEMLREQDSTCSDWVISLIEKENE